MLVLARYPGQTVQLGPDITVKVLDITGSMVRLGFDAPKAMLIQRGERVRAAEPAETSSAPEPQAA